VPLSELKAIVQEPLRPTDARTLHPAIHSRLTLPKAIGARLQLCDARSSLPLSLTGIDPVGQILHARMSWITATREDYRANPAEAMAIAAAAGLRGQAESRGAMRLPYQAIISAADSAQCDLIYMASHGAAGRATFC